MARAHGVSDRLGDFTRNPGEIKQLIHLFPKHRRELAKNTIRLLSELKINREEFHAQRAIRAGSAIEKIREQISSTATGKADPYFLIEMDLTGVSGHLPDGRPYWASYYTLEVQSPDFVLLSPPPVEGGVIFNFSKGLPKGRYVFAMDAYQQSSGQTTFKIKAVGKALDPIAKVLNPSGSRIVDFVPPSHEIGLPMIHFDVAWDVRRTTDKDVIFILKNATDDYLCCLGAGMVGVY